MTREENTAYARTWRKNNPEKVKAAGRRYYQKHAVKLLERAKRLRIEKPEREAAINRKKYLKKEWGLSLSEYDGLLSTQNGVCAICQRPPMKHQLAIDHNHVTGKIRGLLCARCNRAIALLWEDVSIMKKAIDYLEVTLR